VAHCLSNHLGRMHLTANVGKATCHGPKSIFGCAHTAFGFAHSEFGMLNEGHEDVLRSFLREPLFLDLQWHGGCIPSLLGMQLGEAYWSPRPCGRQAAVADLRAPPPYSRSPARSSHSARRSPSAMSDG
jgi:hypothetical protein